MVFICIYRTSAPASQHNVKFPANDRGMRALVRPRARYFWETRSTEELRVAQTWAESHRDIFKESSWLQ